MSNEYSFEGFTTDEEKLVQLGFQSQDSDFGEGKYSDTSKKVKKKNYMRNLSKEDENDSSLTKKSPVHLKDFYKTVYDEMDEEEFNALFQFPNEPIFCSKEILESMDEFLDITFDEQSSKLKQLGEEKKKNKKKRKLYTPKMRFNSINKSMKRHLLKADENEKLSNFIAAFERELVKFMKEEGENKNPRIYVKFLTPFEKFLSIGIIRYYRLLPKNYDHKKVIMVNRVKRQKKVELPKMSLLDYVRELNNKEKKKEENKVGGVEKKKKKKEKELFWAGKKLFEVEDFEYFKVGRRKRKD